ncbi:MAG: CaiB/BaiF CoA transferase family protein [Dehalococcoidia bacterium]
MAGPGMTSNASTETPRVLAGVRVVDLSATLAAAWASRLLADAGADVVLIEPPEGSPIRRMGPFTDAGASVPEAQFLANKRSVTLDLADAASLEVARRLIGGADIVVSSFTPSRLEALGLTYASLGRPELVMTHVTPHGMTGALAEVPGNDLTVGARSGWASINGTQDREPLKPAAWTSSYCAGIAAYGATVAALRWRDGHPGEGQEVDVAEAEVMAGTFAPGMLRSLYTGQAQTRQSADDQLAGPVPVADGHFALTLSRAHFWRDAMNLLGLEDLAEDERYGASWFRQANREEYSGRVAEAMSRWNKMELFDELAIRRVVAGPVLYMPELRTTDHLEARGYWRRPADAPDGPEYPGPAYQMTETPQTLARRAPRAGEHTAEVTREVQS